MKKLFLVCCVAVFNLSSAFAQDVSKVGHIDAAQMVGAMPELLSVESSLNAYAEQLDKVLQADVKILEAEFEKYIAIKDQYSPVKAKTIEQGFQVRYDSLTKQEQINRVNIQVKRNELLSPVVKRFNDAVSEVSKEMGLHYVLDSGSNFGLIYNGTDITEAVCKKLNIAYPPKSVLPEPPKETPKQ